jgi:hypothetical protein
MAKDKLEKKQKKKKSEVDVPGAEVEDEDVDMVDGALTSPVNVFLKTSVMAF